MFRFLHCKLVSTTKLLFCIKKDITNQWPRCTWCALTKTQCKTDKTTSDVSCSQAVMIAALAPGTLQSPLPAASNKQCVLTREDAQVFIRHFYLCLYLYLYFHLYCSPRRRHMPSSDICLSLNALASLDFKLSVSDSVIDVFRIFSRSMIK